MMKLSVFRVVSIGLLMFCYSAYAVKNNNQTTNYLLTPTGQYGVGYQDIFLVNTDVCPDAFYQQNINENDFSVDNKKYCHEIVLRVYYPSTQAATLSDVYYAPALIEENSWLVKTKYLSIQEADNLNTLLKIKTYTAANAAPVKDQKFPMVIFMPGSGMSVHSYTNLVSDLVSNGYIVLGLNSAFINGALQMSNEHVVSPPASYVDADGRRENISDLKFILDHLTELKYNFNLEKIMNFKRIGLVGHSRGAMSIVNLLKQNPKSKDIKGIILLDPGDMMLQANYPLARFSIPSLTIWSSSFKISMQGSAFVGAHNFELVLRPPGAADNYSQHNNFADKSTLQYHPAYNTPALQEVKLTVVGYGNGYEIASELNSEVLEFLDDYLKPRACTR